MSDAGFKFVSNPTERLPLSWEEIHRDAHLLAKRLAAIGEWHQMIAITRGGLVPAALLAHALRIRHIDTLCLARFGDPLPPISDTFAATTISSPTNLPHNGAQEHPTVLKSAAHHANGKGLLIVDDLVDTGVTAKAIRSLYPMAHFATLYAKPAGRSATDSFVREFPQHLWIDFPWEPRP